MKTLFLCGLVVLCSFAMTTNIETAPDSKYTTASAVRLTAKYAKAYRLIVTPAFKVDEKNVLRPSKGYQLIVGTNSGKFRIGPVEFKDLANWKNDPSFDQEPIPGGTVTCFCYAPSDDCRVVFVSDGDAIYYRCDGSCPCNLMAECDDEEAVLGYESPGGGWFNF